MEVEIARDFSEVFQGVGRQSQKLLGIAWREGGAAR
jgi:hypothetical protein